MKKLLATVAALATMSTMAMAERYVMITHTQGTDPFWPVVEKGGRDAAAAIGADFEYNFDIIDTSNHINDHESKTLNLDISKSLKKLSWKPYLPINEAIQLTSQWFKQKEGGKLPSQIIKDQINYYEEKKLFQAQSIRDHIQ